MPLPRRNQARKEQPKYHCRDCSHSYDWHSKAIDGHLILCRCPFKQQGGKYCVFLNDPQCEKFELRKDNAEAQEQIRPTTPV